MRLIAIFAVLALGLSACAIGEFDGGTFYVTVDGKAYKAKGRKIVRQVGLEEEVVSIQMVFVDGVWYGCSGDCALTVQRVLEEQKRRKKIKKIDPAATFPKPIAGLSSH